MPLCYDTMIEFVCVIWYYDKMCPCAMMLYDSLCLCDRILWYYESFWYDTMIVFVCVIWYYDSMCLCDMIQWWFVCVIWYSLSIGTAACVLIHVWYHLWFFPFPTLQWYCFLIWLDHVSLSSSFCLNCFPGTWFVC